MAGPFMLVVFVFFGLDANPQFTQRTEYFHSRDACKLAGMFATGEIGGLAVFLAGDAAQSITGTALPVDGGWTAH